MPSLDAPAADRRHDMGASRKSRSGAAAAFALPIVVVAVALGAMALWQDGPGSRTAPLLLALAAWAWAMLDDRGRLLRGVAWLCGVAVAWHAVQAFGAPRSSLAGVLAATTAAACAAAWARSRHATTGTCQVTLMLASAASAYLALMGIALPEARQEGVAGMLGVTLPFGAACLMLHRMDWSRPASHGMLAAAASLGVVGAACLGLLFGAPFLAGYHGDLVPMTALGGACMLALAGALLAIEFDNRRLALALACLPVVVSLYALAARDVVPGATPAWAGTPLQYWSRGSIAPSAAVTLLVCALALGLGALLRRYRGGATLLWMGGLTAVLVSTIALIALLSGIPREAAGAARSGSVPTVLALWAFGVGLMSSRPVRQLERATRERWLPVCVGVVVCVGAAWLSNAQYQQDRAERARSTTIAGQAVDAALQSARTHAVTLLQPLLRVLEDRDVDPPPALFDGLAASVFADASRPRALYWFDANLSGGVVVRSDASAHEGIQQPVDPMFTMLARRIAAEGVGSGWSGPQRLAGDRAPSIVLLHAVHGEQGRLGYLGLSFDAWGWMEQALGAAAPDHDLRLSFATLPDEVFLRGTPGDPLAWRDATRVAIDLDGTAWTLRLRRAGAGAQESDLAPLVLWSGVLIGALLALALRLAVIGRRRAIDAEAANAALRRSASWETAQREVLTALAAERPVVEVLSLVTRAFEARFPGTRCAVLGVSAPGAAISMLVAPSLPPGWVSHWLGRVPVAPGGAGATCLLRSAPVVAGDVEHDALWEGHRAAARAAGIRSAWAAPIRDAGGCTVGAFEVCLDHTGLPGTEEREVLESVAALAGVVFDRDRARLRVEVSQQWFKSLFERSPNAVIAVGLDGCIVDCNERTIVRSGLRREALMGTAIDAVVGPEQRGEVRRRFALAAAGQAQSFEVSVRLPQGVRDTLATLVPIAVGEEIVGVFVIAADVSERNRVQRELQRALVDLRQRNRELQDFAFVATHDLQEPLRKIQAFSDRVLQRFAPLLPEPGPDYLRRIDASAHRMQVLIDDLLAYSRVATAGTAFADVDLAEVAHDVLADLELRIEESGATVTIGPLPRVYGDRTQLRQLLQNLLANALKFRAPGRPPRIDLDGGPVPERPGMARIRVADNGIGFDPAHAERIFAPFQRLHPADAYGGTGIGLAVVRRIVERHKGSVSAHGEPGRGAWFEIELPALPTAEDHPVASDLPPETTRSVA